MATIPHLDLDALSSSIELPRGPSLKGKPMAIGGGVVLPGTYEVRRTGAAVSPDYFWESRGRTSPRWIASTVSMVSDSAAVLSSR